MNFLNFKWCPNFYGVVEVELDLIDLGIFRRRNCAVFDSPEKNVVKNVGSVGKK